MQKNLKSKVLLTLLAASVFYLPAYANAANLTVDGNNTTEGTLNDWQHKIEDGNSSVNAIYHAPTEEGNQLTITGTPEFISQQNNYYHTLYGAYEDVYTEGQGAKANGNTVTLNGTDFAYADPEIAGAYVVLEDGNATLNNNAVSINSGSFADDTYISGAYADPNSSGTFTLQNNRVTIDGTAFNFTAEAADDAYIRGAYADAGDGSNFNLTGNKIEIINAKFANNNDATAYIYGAAAYIRELTDDATKNNNATFEQNQVLVSGGEFAGTALIAGAYATSQDTDPTTSTATFSKNEVLISGGKFTGDTYIFGVLNDYAQLDATIQDNTVTITGAAGGEGHNLSKAAFYGFGIFEETPDRNDTVANAVINGTDDFGEYISGDDFLKMYSITAANNNLDIDNWSGTIKSAKLFDNINFVNTEWNPGGTVLTIDGAAENDLAKTNIDIVSFASGAEFTPGDSMTFIKGNVDLGIAEKQNNAPETAKYINAGVAQVVNGTTTITEDDTAFKFTVDSVGLAQQTYLVAETRAASAAFVNQGTDLINDSLDVLGRDGTYGVKTFAAVQGNRSSYDVADDLKINGWSVIAGFGAENEHKGGDFAWGVFYENGSGNYRTYNTFNNEFFRGDGSMVYNGGGIAARYENAKGVYTEGSLRAGMLKTEMDNALRDSSGASYGYDSESTYYGAHVGVGQIFELSENTDLDVYGKFFHTYVEGDSFTVGSDKFDFDSVTSDRLRVGARVTKQQAKVNTYYGLAYEYEFNGDADMTAQGIRAERQSFGGGSGIAELGFNYQPGTDSPWNFDLNLRGYVGERQGGSFNVQATYTF